MKIDDAFKAGVKVVRAVGGAAKTLTSGVMKDDQLRKPTEVGVPRIAVLYNAENVGGSAICQRFLIVRSEREASPR